MSEYAVMSKPLGPEAPDNTERDAGNAHDQGEVSRRQMLTKGAKFAAFVTPAMMVLVPPQRADACRGNGNADPSGNAHGFNRGCSN